jgi:hypothetical protein
MRRERRSAPDHSPMATFEQSFCACEDEALRFLVVEHGFRRAGREVGIGGGDAGVYGRALYRADASPAAARREVTLHIAPLRRDLGLELRSERSPPCSIEELHAVDGTGPFPQRVHGLYDAMHDPDQLLFEFSRLAEALRSCGRRFFNDEPSLWDDLERGRRAKAEDESIKAILMRAKASFYARDWPRVVDLLGPLEHRLGKAASARLAYARRKQRRA